MLAVFAVIGIYGFQLLFTTEKEETYSFLDSNEHFRCSFGSYPRVALVSLATSYFGYLLFITTMIFVYFADFSSIQTKLVMASILISALSAKLLAVAVGTPKEIKSNDEELSIERWIQKPRRIPFQAIEKTSIDKKRVSIWYGENQQVAFQAVLLPDLALEHLKSTIKRGANQSSHTTPASAPR
ncbi:hypothetical protein QEH54_22050 [Pelagicoccus sp. SDUM812003]|nr:hypothetical protein [Pelagicoccus sp. SDUM812003]